MRAGIIFLGWKIDPPQTDGDLKDGGSVDLSDQTKSEFGVHLSGSLAL